jgi:hypothetical protein
VEPVSYAPVPVRVCAARNVLDLRVPVPMSYSLLRAVRGVERGA